MLSCSGYTDLIGDFPTCHVTPFILAVKMPKIYCRLGTIPSLLCENSYKVLSFWPDFKMLPRISLREDLPNDSVGSSDGRGSTTSQCNFYTAMQNYWVFFHFKWVAFLLQLYENVPMSWICQLTFLFHKNVNILYHKKTLGLGRLDVQWPPRTPYIEIKMWGETIFNYYIPVTLDPWWPSSLSHAYCKDI